MTSPEMKKAPALGGVTGAIENRKTNPFQEEGITMTPILSRNPRNVELFDTEIRVGNKTVFASDSTVWVHTEIGALSFTPEQACAFAAALSAVGVHVMEETIGEVA